MKYLILLPALLLSLNSFSQRKLSGFIYDYTTGESLIGANIYNNNSGTSTNGYGYFSILSHSDTIIVSYVGYASKAIILKKDSLINIFLKSNLTLDEVIITESINRKKLDLNSMKISSKEISALPVILGEADVFKSIQLLPGISMGNEGGTDFYVRGGSRDQNLIMIDDVPIYNHMHGMGYFSAVNNEVVKDVKVLKGAFPAKYGGRVSSVLDIRTREGSTREINSSISISPFITQATFETPVIKEKSALLLSYRQTALDIISKLVLPQVPRYGFYDSNLKYHHRINDKNIIYSSFYYGADSFRSEFENETGSIGEKSKYGNMLASLRWNHIFNNNVFLNTTLSYNNYEFYHKNHGTDNSQDSLSKNHSFELLFGNKSENFELKLDLEKRLNENHNIQFGGSASLLKYYSYNQYDTFGDFDNYADSSRVYITNKVGRVYFEDQIKYNMLELNLGFNLAVSQAEKITNIQFEPRISAYLNFTENISSSISYSRMSQNIHLVTQSGPLLPEDIWFPSTDSIPPVVSDIFSIGGTIKNNKFRLYTELFYKHMDNVTESKITSRGEPPFTLIEVGKGKAFGVESMLEFNSENVNLNLNYTFSRSLRYFDDINFGEVFPFRYDRPHDLTFFGTYKINKSWNISTIITYKSGSRTTLKQGVYGDPLLSSSSLNNGIEYYDNDNYLDYYGGRNGYQLPDYFRWDIDLSYNYGGSWGNYIVKFGIYNLTNHHNADKLTVNNNKIYSESLIPVLPYISYSWRLK